MVRGRRSSYRSLLQKLFRGLFTEALRGLFTEALRGLFTEALRGLFTNWLLEVSLQLALHRTLLAQRKAQGFVRGRLDPQDLSQLRPCNAGSWKTSSRNHQPKTSSTGSDPRSRALEGRSHQQTDSKKLRPPASNPPAAGPFAGALCRPGLDVICYCSGH